MNTKPTPEVKGESNKTIIWKSCKGQLKCFDNKERLVSVAAHCQSKLDSFQRVKTLCYIAHPKHLNFMSLLGCSLLSRRPTRASNSKELDHFAELELKLEKIFFLNSKLNSNKTIRVRVQNRTVFVSLPNSTHKLIVRQNSYFTSSNRQSRRDQWSSSQVTARGQRQLLRANDQSPQAKSLQLRVH